VAREAADRDVMGGEPRSPIFRRARDAVEVASGEEESREHERRPCSAMHLQGAHDKPSPI
jgi:hypothetical protein